MSAEEAMLAALVAERLIRSATSLRVIWDRRQDLVRLGSAEFAIKERKDGAAG